MRYGLIGEKLGHSFSKEIHERIANYTYDLIPLSHNEFTTFMEKHEFTAINVTIPYKKAVIPYLDEIDDAAKAIQAVNTIVNHNGSLKGYNTDFTGFLYMVKKHNICMKDKKVIVIGNGGASAAIQAAVKHEQAREMIIVDIFVGNGAISYDECYEKHLDAQVIINTSPVGMYPNINASPIDLSQFKNLEAVLDVVYNPLCTLFAHQAKKLNIPHVNGLEMLIAQAKYAVEFFLNESIDDAIIDEIYKDMINQRLNIVLIGMPSCGKTTLSKLLSEKLHKQCIDLDEEIVASQKITIPEIFKNVKEEGFRKIESDIAYEVSKSNNMIISTGGGIIKNKVNMDVLGLNGIIIFIDRDVDKLIHTDSNRPLSSSEEAVKKLYAQRYDLYCKYGDIIVKNNGSIDDCLEEIIHKYKEYVNKY